MATQKDPTIFGYQNFYSSTLTGDITSGTLTIGLATVPTPTSGILIIEPDSTSSREVIFYTSKGASTITCPSDGRGWSGSSASAHLTGSTVIMASVDEYFEGLADGTLSADPLRSSFIPNHVVSGGAVALSSGLIGTMSAITVHLAGQRYTSASIPNKTYTASRDTYVDVSAVSGGAVTITYSEVTNGAASPSLAAGAHRVARVVTSGSAITRIDQVGYDSLGNRFYNTCTAMPSLLNKVGGAGVNLSASADEAIKICFYKPKDIMTVGGLQRVKFQPFPRNGGSGNMSFYRISYFMRPASAYATLEGSSGVTAGQTANYQIITTAGDLATTDYWSDYDLVSYGDGFLRVDFHRDGANGSDTNPNPTDLEGAVMYYNKDYSKSY